MSCFQLALWLRLSICPYPSSSLLEYPYIRIPLLAETYLRSPWLVYSLRSNHSTFSGLRRRFQQFGILPKLLLLQKLVFCSSSILNSAWITNRQLPNIQLPDYLWGFPVTIFSVTGLNLSWGVCFLPQSWHMHLPSMLGRLSQSYLLFNLKLYHFLCLCCYFCRPIPWQCLLKN